MTEHTHADIYADIDRAYVKIKRLESRITELESKLDTTTHIHSTMSDADILQFYKQHFNSGKETA